MHDYKSNLPIFQPNLQALPVKFNMDFVQKVSPKACEVYLSRVYKDFKHQNPKNSEKTGKTYLREQGI